MNAKLMIWRVTAGVQAVLLSGCATKALWENKSYYEPSDRPELRLYLSRQQKDVLVQYTEFQERKSTLKRRSYFLYRNEDRIAANRKPHFVNPEKVRGVTRISIVKDKHALPPPVEAELSADWREHSHRFALYSQGQKIGTYGLPVYPDAARRAEQVLLTPLAVVADVTLVSGVLALIGLWGIAESGYTGTL